jgi:hypothetical protein
MQPDPIATNSNRPLTDSEYRLARWMLEHGDPAGRDFLPQLELAVATAWQCPCGCASIRFQIKGRPPAPPGVHVLGDFVFGDEDTPDGIFIFENGDLLSGIEVYEMGSRVALTSLPSPESLRQYGIWTD